MEGAIAFRILGTRAWEHPLILLLLPPPLFWPHFSTLPAAINLKLGTLPYIPYICLYLLLYAKQRGSTHSIQQLHIKVPYLHHIYQIIHSFGFSTAAKTFEYYLLHAIALNLTLNRFKSSSNRIENTKYYLRVCKIVICEYLHE
jgi:hypothetical protein